MTFEETLRTAALALAGQGIEDAPLEAELLLRHLLGLDRAQLYLRLKEEFPAAESTPFQALLERRLRGEPTAYITGRKEFFGLDFYVDQRVLIPRPETEVLVEKALEFAQGRSLLLIADIGTGCGAIAIALALHLPQARVYATDLSAAALEVAALNCERYGLTPRIALLRGHLLDPLPEAVDLIVANLPYVKKGEMAGLSPEVRHEPREALFGGSSGLKWIRDLLAGAGAKLRQGGGLLLEVAPDQAGKVASLARRHFPGARIEIVPDLSGHGRLVSLKRKDEVVY